MWSIDDACSESNEKKLRQLQGSEKQVNDRSYLTGFPRNMVIYIRMVNGKLRFFKWNRILNDGWNVGDLEFNVKLEIENYELQTKWNK